jgi:hypothetical protein
MGQQDHNLYSFSVVVTQLRHAATLARYSGLSCSEKTGVRVRLAVAGGWTGCTAIFACMAGAVASPAPADAQDAPAMVYCLASANRLALVEAAVALKQTSTDASGNFVVVDGKTLDPSAWRDQQPEAFNTTCTALYSASRPLTASSPGVFSSVLPFLTALLGAFAAFFAATWRDKVARGRVLGDGLRSSVEDFYRAADSYLRLDSPNAETVELKAHRGAVVAKLAVVEANHRKWIAVHALRADLEAGRFGDSLTRGWDAQNQATRERAEKLRTTLTCHRDVALHIANALEQPLRPHRSLRQTGEAEQS